MRYLLAVSLIWAFSFGLIKTRLAGYDPLLVAAARMTLALLPFAPWLRRVGSTPLRLRLMGLGALQFGLMYIFYIASFATLPAYAVALFTVTTPFYVLAFCRGSRRGDRGRNLLAALLAVAGAGWVAWRALPGAEAWPGILLLQASNICFAAGQVWYRRLRRDRDGLRRGETGRDEGATAPAAPEVAWLAWMYLGAVVITVAAAAVWGEAPRATPPAADLLALLYLGLIPSGLAFWMWNRGAARAAPGALAVANNLKIPLAVGVAWVVFGESAPYVRVLAGLAVVALGLALVRSSETAD